MPKERSTQDDDDGVQRKQLKLLAKAVQDLARARSIDEAVAALRAATRDIIGADGIAVVLRDGAYCHYVAEDALSTLWTGQRFPLTDCIAGHAMIEGTVIAIPDVRRDPRVPQDAYRGTFVRRMAAAAIGAPDAAAALCAYWAKSGPIDGDTLEALQTLASAAATAIENGRLFEALVASEWRFRNLFESSPVGLAIYNPADRALPDVNDAMLAMGGMTRKEFETGAWDFVRATAPECYERDNLSREEAILTGRVRPYEKAFVHRDGHRVPALISAAPLEGESGLMIFAAQELSATKAAEAALARSEAMLRGITETVGGAFYTIEHGEDGPSIAYISAAFEDIWGRSRESLVAEPMSFLDAVHPEDRPRVEQAMARQKQGHETETEYRISDLEGREKWIFSRAYPVTGETGEVIRLIGVAEDITARKHTEMRAALIAQEMEHRARNLMTIVRGIIGQTLRSQPVPPAVTELLLGRLAALSAAHKAIIRRNYTSASMNDLVTLALEPFRADASRINLAGPDLDVAPQIGLILALALHELATNALKHGALSVPSGHVELVWEPASIGDQSGFRLMWRETGGLSLPTVRPATEGFGTNLLEKGLAWYGGEACLDFAPGGLTATLTLPLSLNQQDTPETGSGDRTAA